MGFAGGRPTPYISSGSNFGKHAPTLTGFAARPAGRIVIRLRPDTIVRAEDVLAWMSPGSTWTLLVGAA